MRWKRPIAWSALWLSIVLLLPVAAGLAPGRSAPVLWAQGTGAAPVQVLGYQEENNFPHHLTIGVTLEGRHEIREVRVSYRSPGSRVWAYGYSDFDPGRQVSASFRIPTSGANYMPPGATLEYYFTVRDALDNVHETPTRELEYRDTRFQWEQVQIGPLALYYHDVPRPRVEALARELEGEMRRLENLLELDAGEPTRGFIYNRYSEAAPAFPRQSRTITDQEVFHGFAFPAYQVFLGIGLQPRIIVHEAAHLMLAQSLGPGYRQLPAWLDEGFASYAEPGSNPYSGRSLSSRGPSLRAMATVSGTPVEINHFYLKSESVVAFLINEHGTEAFQGLLGELRQGRSIDAALVNTYGFDTDGLEAAWAVSTVGRGSLRIPDPLTPFVLFNSWFLGGLFLVVMAAVFVRYVYRRLHGPDEDEEEGLQPWEDPDLEDQRRVE